MAGFVQVSLGPCKRVGLGISQERDDMQVQIPLSKVKVIA